MSDIRERLTERGMALVMVALVLTVLTAMVTEFAYSVYVNTSLLTNWQRLQEISLTAESGVSVAKIGLNRFDLPDKVFDIPPMDPFGLGISVGIRVEDEHAKFNINKVVNPNGEKNELYYDALIRLLQALDLETSLADSLKDYIDPDWISDSHSSEDGARNAPLESVDELASVAGVTREVYNILLPHVTVFGDGRINIKTAEVPVLMTLAPNIGEDMAQRVIDTRNDEDFKLNAVPGFETPLLPTVNKGDTFKVVSVAMDEDGLTREIRCVMKGNGQILYWREL